MSVVNPQNVIAILQTYFPPSELATSSETQSEREIAEHIRDLLNNVGDSELMHVETESDLIFGDESDLAADEEDEPDDGESDEEPYANEPVSTNSYEKDPVVAEKTQVPDEYKAKAVSYWEETLSRTGKKRSFRSVQGKWKRLPNRQALYRWAKQIKANGTRDGKLAEIRKQMLERFIEAKNSCLVVHDSDLKRWSLESAYELEFSGFKASPNFINRFKKQLRIVSRKVTKFITVVERENETELRNIADKFVAANNSNHFSTVDHAAIMNTDQSGFQKEMHTKRTLAFKGTQGISAVVQSISATTHSYSIQPTISAAGEFVGKMLVVLQEPQGKFGPVVEKNIFVAPNLVVLASKSGKLEKRHSAHFFENLLFPELKPGSSVLLHDSWTGFADYKLLLKNFPDSVVLAMEKIPPKTTRFAQPCDRFIFRQYKVFYKEISDLVLALGLDTKLYERNTIIKLQSLTFNQFCSPRYKEMIRFAWFLCGYDVLAPTKFFTPGEFSFRNKANLTEKICHFCIRFKVLYCG